MWRNLSAFHRLHRVQNHTCTHTHNFQAEKWPRQNKNQTKKITPSGCSTALSAANVQSVCACFHNAVCLSCHHLSIILTNFFACHFFFFSGLLLLVMCRAKVRNKAAVFITNQINVKVFVNFSFLRMKFNMWHSSIFFNQDPFEMRKMRKM